MKNLVVYDLETTGLDKLKDQIIQFAAIKVDRESGKILESKNLYIQPVGDYSISIQAYFKHHIKPEDLKDKPTFTEVAQEIFDFFDGCDILTYNGCSFDNSFLTNSFKRVGMDFDVLSHDCYDAFLEEKRRNGNTLEATFERYYGKTMSDMGLTAHDALSDVKATYGIFKAQQKAKTYGPEELLSDDNVIQLMEFNGELVPCFTLGKYKQLGIKFVSTFDKNYLKWAISDKSSFSDTTKKYISQFI